GITASVITLVARGPPILAGFRNPQSPTHETNREFTLISPVNNNSINHKGVFANQATAFLQTGFPYPAAAAGLLTFYVQLATVSIRAAQIHSMARAHQVPANS